MPLAASRSMLSGLVQPLLACVGYLLQQSERERAGYWTRCHCFSLPFAALTPWALLALALLPVRLPAPAPPLSRPLRRVHRRDVLCVQRAHLVQRSARRAFQNSSTSCANCARSRSVTGRGCALASCSRSRTSSLAAPSRPSLSVAASSSACTSRARYVQASTSRSTRASVSILRDALSSALREDAASATARACSSSLAPGGQS